MKRFRLTLSIILAAVCMAGCGSARRVQDMGSGSQDQFNSVAREYFFLEGARRSNENRPDAAMEMLRHSVAIDTTSAAAWFELAQCYIVVNDRKRTEECLLRAIQLEPQNFWYRRLLAVVYSRLRKVEQAIDQYEQMVALFPGNSNLLLELAELYDQIGQYSKELKVINRYGVLEDMTDQLNDVRFYCYLQMGRMDSAFMETDNPGMSIERLMENVESRTMLDMALSFCREVEKRDPTVYQAFLYQALVEFQSGEREKSFETLDRSLRTVWDAQSRAKLYNLMGEFHHTMGQVDKTYQDYDSTLVYAPDDVGTLNNYAYFLSLENRDLKRALEMSRRSIEVEPTNATYLDTYGWILFMMGDYRKSLEYIEKALRYIDTDSPDIYEHYGDVLFKCGDTEKALENWHKARQLNSTSKTLNDKIREQKYIE